LELLDVEVDDELEESVLFEDEEDAELVSRFTFG
jgi:hypothetical protein